SGLKKSKIKVSLFVEPNLEMVRLSQALGVDAIEIHTGRFAIATQQKQPTIQKELCKIEKATTKALELGLKIHAGHGLDYENIRLLVDFKSVFKSIEEYNIGHSIVCRATMVGLESAVREMLSLIQSP
ncbi:MAG: pyridoxine 5'-phosphate synthase, partial [Bdellovibrio sp.]|nr:pyridoxine 5'-phosphate synthase [Bdellovibrio sp.]